MAAAGLPHAVVGVVIARWCCCPRPWPPCALPARDRMQTSLNLALGSAMASIGLTIPAIALASVWLAGRCCWAWVPRRWCCWL